MEAGHLSLWPKPLFKPIYLAFLITQSLVSVEEILNNEKQQVAPTILVKLSCSKQNNMLSNSNNCCRLLALDGQPLLTPNTIHNAMHSAQYNTKAEARMHAHTSNK